MRSLRPYRLHIAVLLTSLLAGPALLASGADLVWQVFPFEPVLAHVLSLVLCITYGLAACLVAATIVGGTLRLSRRQPAGARDSSGEAVLDGVPAAVDLSPSARSATWVPVP